ncbi:MAG: hypothetical protein ABSH11_04185 [Verrucomicrobiota bacterium]
MRLEDKLAKIQSGHEQELADASRQLHVLNSEHDKCIQQRDAEIETLKTKSDSLQETISANSLKNSARWRFAATLAGLVAFEGLTAILANKYGEGTNLFQKILNSWKYFALVLVVVFLFGGRCIGRHRLKALGWPFSSLFDRHG